MAKIFRRMGATAAAGTALLLGGCAHPSDSHLETVFHEHESQFVTILDMVRQDRDVFSVLWLDSHSLSPRGAELSNERFQAYEKLCRPLGIWRVSLVHDRLELLVSSVGLYSAGSVKGFVYSEVPLSPSLPTLDSGLPDKNSRAGYKTLARNWYIFFEKD